MLEALRLRQACETIRELAMLPLERVEHPLVVVVRDPERPDVWDANHACNIRAETASEIEQVLAFVEGALPPNIRHRDFRCDPLTPPAFVARLLHEGFEATATIQMRLDESPARVDGPVSFRLAETDADWESLDAMAEANRLEEAEREGREPYGSTVSTGLNALRRASSPPLRMWIAKVEGRDSGHAGSFVGPAGFGMVEWVYVAPEVRRRGVASALVAHAAGDARAEGAATVLIGPLEGAYEAPRRCYERLGFRPWFPTQRYLRAEA